MAAFGGFSGFEGAATLGEESQRSTRTIPAAIVGALVVSALVYIAFTWLVDNAYPSANVMTLANDPAPLAHVASIYVSPAMAKVVTATAQSAPSAPSWPASMRPTGYFSPWAGSLVVARAPPTFWCAQIGGLALRSARC